MKTLILTAIRCSLMFTTITAPLFSVGPAQAYTVTLQQIGSNIVATGGGAIDLTGLTANSFGNNYNLAIEASSGLIETGAFASKVDLYTGSTGPTSFGRGRFFAANTGSGDYVGIVGFLSQGQLFLPQGYFSDTALSSSATWNNATYASLGVTPGTYIWSWGTGLPNQNFTLIIGGALRRKLGC
jgi:hypothetical protein